MSSPTSFDTSQARRSLGVNRGVDIPGIEPELRQIVLMADMSDSFGAQRFEARGFGSTFRAAIVNQFVVSQLISNASGGIVIERVDVFAHTGVTPHEQVTMVVQDRNITIQEPVPSSGEVVNVGGSEVNSQLNSFGTLLIPPTNRVFVNLDPTGRKTLDNFGWFIRPGFAYQVHTNLFGLGVEMAVEMQWREIPQSPG